MGFETNGYPDYVNLGDWSHATCFADVESCTTGICSCHWETLETLCFFGCALPLRGATFVATRCCASVRFLSVEPTQTASLAEYIATHSHQTDYLAPLRTRHHPALCVRSVSVSGADPLTTPLISQLKELLTWTCLLMNSSTRRVNYFVSYCFEHKIT